MSPGEQIALEPPLTEVLAQYLQSVARRKTRRISTNFASWNHPVRKSLTGWPAEALIRVKGLTNV
jgi:hypothetical protein